MEIALVETDNSRLDLIQDDLTFELAVTRLYEICQQRVPTSPSSVEEIDGRGYTPLLYAISGGVVPPAIIQRMVTACPDATQLTLTDKSTALHLASRLDVSLASLESALEIMKYLVEAWPESVQQESDQQFWDESPELPLHCALRQNRMSLDNVRFLVEQFPKALRVNRKVLPISEVALHVALRNNAPLPIIQYLVEQWPEALKRNGVHGLPLHVACIKSFRMPLTTINFLIDSWLDALKVPDGKGCLPLHAVFREHVDDAELIKLLITRCPDAVRIAGFYDQQLPLHLACQYDVPLTVIELLIEAWPDSIRVPDGNGYLMYPHKC